MKSALTRQIRKILQWTSQLHLLVCKSAVGHSLGQSSRPGSYLDGPCQQGTGTPGVGLHLSPRHFPFCLLLDHEVDKTCKRHFCLI